MIHSMTGFGKASLQLPTKKITVEIKSLNSKGLDLNTRMPSVFREMELGLRNQISQRLERGKVDFSLYVEVTGEETTSKINVPIVKGYINQMKAVIPNADETELMKMAVRMPDALKTERDEIDENEWKHIQTVIDEALENIANFRKDEGASLEKEFQLRIANIESSIKTIKQICKENNFNYRSILRFVSNSTWKEYFDLLDEKTIANFKNPSLTKLK